MKYNVSSDALSGAFVVPCAVVDKHIKLATPLQLRVLLCVFRNLSDGVDAKKIAEHLSAEPSDVTDALDYWVGVGILKGEKPEEKPAEKITVAAPIEEMPSYDEVMQKADADKNLSLLLKEAQLCVGGGISQNMSRYLLYLYEDCGMDTSVILYLLSYAAKKEKCNLTFIKTVSASWLKAGVETVNDVENLLKKSAVEDLAFSVVLKAFGLEKRRPSEKEKELSTLWVNEWGISSELLRAAYDACVDAKSKFNFAYTAKIIESWHKDGIKSPEDINKNKPTGGKKPSKYDYGGFDINKFDEMLDKD